VIHHTVTIAHISDLHIAGRNDRRSLALLEKMLRHLDHRGIDHLVITGDICDVASPTEWQALRDVLTVSGFWSFDRTTLLPGNHDLINIEEEVRLYNALNPFSDSRRHVFRQRLASFASFFGELITGDSGSLPGFPFIKVLRFAGLSLAFVGVNSVWPWHRSDNPLGARGFIDPAELQALRRASVASALEESFVIGLCHHALRVYGTQSPIDQAFDWTMELVNRNDYLSVMKFLNASVLLHGHFHRFQTYMMDSVQVVNGGSFRYTPERYSLMRVGDGGSFSQQFLVVP
jgi:UDP-2,3-diacylglucosamine pyrophosphatase LpxH